MDNPLPPLIERLAREAGWHPYTYRDGSTEWSSPSHDGVMGVDLERFAALVARECVGIATARAALMDRRLGPGTARASDAIEIAGQIDAAFLMPKG